jgi:hypothetical protein
MSNKIFNPHIYKKSFGLYLFLILLLLSGTWSCKNQSTRQAPEDCITISRTKLNGLLGKGWQDPKHAEAVPVLCFDTYTKDGKITNVEIIPTNGKFENRYKMAKMDVKKNCTFDSKLQVHRNYYKFDPALYYDAAAGKLKDFKWLRLVPKACPEDPAKLSFDVYIITHPEKQLVAATAGESFPCPIYCCPGPYCPGNTEESDK